MDSTPVPTLNSILRSYEKKLISTIKIRHELEKTINNTRNKIYITLIRYWFDYFDNNHKYGKEALGKYFFDINNISFRQCMDNFDILLKNSFCHASEKISDLVFDALYDLDDNFLFYCIKTSHARFVKNKSPYILQDFIEDLIK